MISGKAISRAVRCHFLVQSALVTNLFKPFIDDGDHEAEDIEDDISVAEDEKTVETVKREDVLRELENVTKYVKDEGKTTEDIESKNYPVLFQLEDMVENYKEYLIRSSRTAKLWLLNIYYVVVVKIFVRAERSGYWNLHVVAISKMLNLFAATGHINYAKSARLHLQNMLNLKNTHPWINEQFTEGLLHTVRRSEKFWAGFWTDLIIE